MSRLGIPYWDGRGVSVEHAETVRDLWIFLRANGVDARLDRPAAERRRDWPVWMGEQVRAAEHILVIASAAYRERVEGRAGPDEGRGVQWEARLIRDAFYTDQQSLDRFVPVVLPGQSVDGVPDWLAPATSTVYSVESFTVAGAEKLLRLLLGRPGEVDPPLRVAPDLPQRGHGLSSATDMAAAGAAMMHEVVVHVAPAERGGVRTRTEVAGTLLGEQVAGLPHGLGSCWTLLDSPTGHELLAVLGQGLWRALFDEPTGARLVELIDHSPFGSVIEVVVVLAEELVGLPVELLRLPDGRLAATVAGVRVTRRLAGVDREPTPPLGGPLKILAAFAAPEETVTGSAAVDVEEQMQALLDAVDEADLSEQAQVRILEVASLDEVTKALGDDQYHVLHLFGHGSPDGIELEDEDGNARFAGTAQLVDALRGGGRLLPVLVLSGCSGAAGGTNGLAAELVAEPDNLEPVVVQRAFQVASNSYDRLAVTVGPYGSDVPYVYAVQLDAVLAGSGEQITLGTFTLVNPTSSLGVYRAEAYSGDLRQADCIRHNAETLREATRFGGTVAPEISSLADRFTRAVERLDAGQPLVAPGDDSDPPASRNLPQCERANHPTIVSYEQHADVTGDGRVDVVLTQACGTDRASHEVTFFDGTDPETPQLLLGSADGIDGRGLASAGIAVTDGVVMVSGTAYRAADDDSNASLSTVDRFPWNGTRMVRTGERSCTE